MMRIKNIESMQLKQDDLKEPFSSDLFAFNLIASMLAIKPDDRPEVGEIVNRKFFLAPVRYFRLYTNKDYKQIIVVKFRFSRRLTTRNNVL